MFENKRIYCALGYRCNNHCLFCAVDSSRLIQSNCSTKELYNFFNEFKGLKNIDFELSGGEATIRDDFLDILTHIRRVTPKNNVILLSNGRRFSDVSFTSKYSDIGPESTGIALHGDISKVHDFQTQIRGSFDETILGIKNLFDYSLSVDLKIIVNKLNYKKLPQIVQFIAQTFPELHHMSLNALDICGMAYKNQEIVFVPLKTIMPYVQKSIDVAVNQGLLIRTYNIPYCLFDEEYYGFIGAQNVPDLQSKKPGEKLMCVSSTSGIVDKCVDCKYIKECSGTWYSYFKLYGVGEISPIRM